MVGKQSQSVEPSAGALRRLTAVDWLLAVIVFAATTSIACAILPFTGGVNPNFGEVGVVGVGVMGGLVASLVCAGVWQYPAMSDGPVVLQLRVLALYTLATAVFVALGFRCEGRTIIGVVLHGMPINTQVLFPSPWYQLIGIALGMAYVQFWTAIRAVIHSAVAIRRVGSEKAD